jgi:hypothetical protein
MSSGTVLMAASVLVRAAETNNAAGSLRIGVVQIALAGTIADTGCKVGSVERFPCHPVWRIALAQPWPELAGHRRRSKYAVRKTIRALSPCHPAEDLDVVCKGKRLLLLFIWDAPTRPGLLALQTTRAGFLEQREDGLWYPVPI